VLAVAVLAVIGVVLGLELGGPAGTSASLTQVPSAYQFAVAGATQYTCSTGFRSVGGQRAAQVVFSNLSGAAVQVFWLDFSGGHKLYVQLEPGASQLMKTYVGDYWLIADAAGKCLGVFGVNSGGRIVVNKA